MECGCLHGWVTENGRARNHLTLCSVHVLVHVQVRVHTPDDPQSVQLRNATTTSKSQDGSQTQIKIESTEAWHTFKDVIRAT